MTIQVTTANAPDPALKPHEWRDFALAAGKRAGFELTGAAGVAPSARLALFPDWIEQGNAGAMQYLARRGEDGRYLRESIRQAWPWARSVLCGAAVYNAAPPRASVPRDAERGWISRYAWGSNYHDILRTRLEAWIRELRPLGGPADHFQPTVDTAPLVERDAALRAGLGWQGKNTCLLHPQAGSFFFLAAIITSLDLGAEADAPLPDRCGTCTRCIQACPTQALTPYQMDASRCLAYLNIELRGPIPEPFRAALGDNLLGCDICQDVCPWNRRAPRTEVPEFQPRPGLFAPLLEELAELSEAGYREKFRGSAVKRAKYAGLRRNLALAMGNSGNPGFAPRLERWTQDPDPVLAEHASWALARLAGGAQATPGPGTDVQVSTSTCP